MVGSSYGAYFWHQLSMFRLFGAGYLIQSIQSFSTFRLYFKAASLLGVICIKARTLIIRSCMLCWLSAEKVVPSASLSSCLMRIGSSVRCVTVSLEVLHDDSHGWLVWLLGSVSSSLQLSMELCLFFGFSHRSLVVVSLRNLFLSILLTGVGVWSFLVMLHSAFTSRFQMVFGCLCPTMIFFSGGWSWS